MKDERQRTKDTKNIKGKCQDTKIKTKEAQQKNYLGFSVDRLLLFIIPKLCKKIIGVIFTLQFNWYWKYVAIIN